jgi:Holliday junction resolvase RusA-like endonuclease
MTSITITVPIPSPKLAHNGRIHWRQRAKLVKECRLSSGILARQALGKNPAPMWDRATAKVIAYFPTNAFPDPMNLLDRCKAVFDGFEDVGIIIDDANLWPLRPEMHKDATNPRLEITITEEL